MIADPRMRGSSSACWCGQPPAVRYRELGALYGPRHIWRCARHTMTRPGRRYEVEIIGPAEAP